MLNNRNVLVGIGILQPSLYLSTRLIGVEIVALEMQTHNRAVLLLHQLITGLYSLLYHRYSTTAQRWEDTGGTIFGMCLNGSAESLFRSFLEVGSATAMHMHLYESGHNIHTFGIYEFSPDDCQVTVGYL